jgi:hypothetical protein
VEPPQIVATALTLALIFTPSESQLLKDVAPKERGTHRHVTGDPPSTVFPQIVCPKRGIHRPAAKIFDQSGNTTTIENNIVVEKHQPLGVPAGFGPIPSPGDDLPSARVFRACASYDPVHMDSHPLLATNSLFHGRMERLGITRQHHQVNCRNQDHCLSSNRGSQRK